MKYFHVFNVVVIISLLAGVISCTDNEDLIQNDSITIASSDNISQIFSSEGGTSTISFSSSGPWTIYVAKEDKWVSVSPERGEEGDATINISVSSNETHDERKATIYLRSGKAHENILVTQRQKDALVITPTKHEVSHEGAEIQVEVVSNIDYEVEIADSSKEWIHDSTQQTRGLESNQLTFTIDPNYEFENREGKITIRSGEFTENIHVYQEAGENVVLLNKNKYLMGTEGGVIEVELKSNCSYTMTMPDVDWIKESTGTRAMSTHTLYFEISPNDGHGDRSAEIVFSDENASMTETLYIYQVQKNTVILSKNECDIPKEGGVFEIEYSSNIDLFVNIPDEHSWLNASLTEEILKIEIERNASKDDRNCIVVLQDYSGKFTETITITQTGLDYYLRVPGHDENITGICNYMGGLFGMDVESNGDYKFEIIGDDVSWIHPASRETRGKNMFTELFEVDENNTGKEREVRLKFTLSNITRSYGFAQAPKMELFFSQESFDVSSEGGKYRLDIQASGKWAQTYNEFWFYSIPSEASSWVSIERNTMSGSMEDTAYIIIQPNLTSQSRSTSIFIYVFAGEEYYINIHQSAAGTIVISPKTNYILSSGTHTETINLVTSGYSVEIDGSWISLGTKTGEGEEIKQEILIAENSTNRERNGSVTFISGSTKNQITFTQLMSPPELIDDTPEKWHDFPLPEVTLKLTNPNSEGSQIYKAIVPDCEKLIAISSHKVLDCLYSNPDDSRIPRPKTLEYVLEDFDGVSYNAGTKIGLSNQYLAGYYKQHGAEAMIRENIGILGHELTHSYQAQPKNCGGYTPGTHFFAFIEGVADAVRVLCGGFPNDSDRPRGGHYMNGYRETGFFLAWLVNNKDADFLRKFNESAHVLETWTFEAGIKYALGEQFSADGLWTEYQKAMGDI